MIDRQALADELVAGLAGPADTPISPSNPVYPVLKQLGLPSYPYDPAQAQRLMADAGWTKGADGMFHPTAGGPPLSMSVAVRGTGSFGANNLREVQGVVSLYRSAGIDATVTSTGGGGVLQREAESTNRGMFGLPLRESHSSFLIYRSDQIGTAPQWNGGNFAGYSNPEYDRLYNASLLAFDLGERNKLLAGALKLLAEDAVAVNMFYDMGQQTVVFRKGIRGPIPSSPLQNAAAWNIHTWEMD